ncbi:hypothetical protein [Myxococcus sp. CA040A]|uniref:hypothetical protein n=1 Tax=Myxococcus sp. CA040A TaxID=2741738 RepID=UPI00157B2894|nr:hypothetical protein [Myxococcus sp. CA040A]NTX08278.1 hypothetical protein [Myxococcus sp. CA040A]
MSTCLAPRQLLYRETRGPEGRRVTIHADGLKSVVEDAATNEEAQAKAFAAIEAQADAAGLTVDDFDITTEYPPEEVLS